MRRLSLLVVAALTLVAAACGSPVSDSGNAWVTESALDSGHGPSVVTLTPVTVDSSDRGCSVDGVRHSVCVFTQTSTVDYDGPLNLCELQLSDGTTHVWECEIAEAANARIEQAQEFPNHCPESGA